MTHYIAIIDISDKETKYKVVNAVVLARPEDSVYFFNETEHGALVKFDTEPPWGTDELTVARRNRSGAHGLSKPGYYPFDVFIGDTKAEATKPIIIIYD